MQLFRMMLAASADQAMDIGERVTMGLQVTLFGMAVVFSVLLLIWGILVLFRIIFYDIPNRKTAAAKPAESAPVAEPAPEPESESVPVSGEPEGDEAEVVAAITAAVSLMLDKPQTSFRVVSFRRTASK